MLVVQQNLKTFTKLSEKKAQAIKDIEKGLSNKEVAANIICQKIPYLHASKNKDKILSSLKQGQKVKQKKLCGAAHEASDQARSLIGQSKIIQG